MLAAYRAGDARVAAWLGARADADAAAYARDFARRGAWDRPALSAILREAVASAGDADALAPAAHAAARLADPATICVVAGQQPAVGGGPLYTLVKAAQAIASARALDAAGVPAVPIFWCASEDHDLGEADHADLLRRDASLARVHVDLGPGRASLRFRPAAAAFAAVTARLREVEPNALAHAWWSERAPRADEGIGAWQCRLLMRAFARHGLVAVEAHRLRPLWRAALARALDAWPARELAARRAEVVAAGFADVLGELAEPPLFRDDAGGRAPLARDAARALAAREPDALSPGAALRPALQQAALPAACAVLGPGELAYHALIGPVYAALGVPRPLAQPRTSIALAPAWLRRAAARWDVDPATLAPDARPPTTPTPLADELRALDRALDALADAGRGQSTDLPRRVAAGVARLTRERDRLRASLARGDRRARGVAAFATVVGWLWPRGEPQDRVLSLAQPLFTDGAALGDALVDACAATRPGDRRVVPL